MTTKNKSYTYDNLNRLATANGPWGSISWTLDPVGNRLTQVDGSGTSSYTYATGSNKLSAITGANPASFTSDANGNTLSENARIFTYNQNQRLIQSASTQTGNYVYNANGQRVKKTVGGAVTVYHYDQNGQLIAESSNTGAVQAEYVYLNGIPLAKIDGSGTQYIHTDHLGTPVMMTDAARAIVWEIENRPFGDGATVTGTASLNLRFPGQYFDVESGLNYNYFRDYNPVVGRYVQADPIGLAGGENHLFVYSASNPVAHIDPMGLLIWVCNRKAEGIVGFLGGNHAYLWDDRTNKSCGMRGSSGYGGHGSPKDKGPFSPVGTNCVPVLGSRGKESAIMTCCEKTSNVTPAFPYTWFPVKQDCHTAAKRCVEGRGLKYPGAPGGRLGKPCDPCKNRAWDPVG